MNLANAGLIRLLGIAVHDGGFLTLTPTADHTNAFGTVHLAVLTALGEGAAWLAMGENAVPTSVVSNFLRPTKIGEPLSTQVSVVNTGKTLGLVDASVTQGGKVVATFRVSVMFFEPAAK